MYPQQPHRGVVCQGLFGLGLPEIAVIAGVAALIFGPSKLPELGKGLGKTVKSFQTAAKEFKTELEAAAAADDDDPAAAAAKEAEKPAAKKE
jgi:sec-independent protein translocase protein TatA